MSREPHDSFDHIPPELTRQGVHRASPTRGGGWVTFAWAALATGILVGVGAGGLYLVDHPIQFETQSVPTAVNTPTETPTPTPTVVPTTDPTATVAILNGTATEGLATRAARRAEAAGWTIAARGNAKTTDVTTTTVYYVDAAAEGAAKGLALALGGAAVVQSDQFSDAELTVVLGTDYHEAGATSTP